LLGARSGSGRSLAAIFGAPSVGALGAFTLVP
jgi:hypothetical protein